MLTARLALGAIAVLTSLACVAEAPSYKPLVVSPPAGYRGLTGTKVNNISDFIGSALPFPGPDAERKPVVWLSEGGFFDIPLPDGQTIVQLTDISDARHVVGLTNVGAFLWSPEDGIITIRPSKGYRDPQPTGVNKSGRVGGFVYLQNSTGFNDSLRRGFVWSTSDRVMNIPKASLEIAPVDISNSGNIVASVKTKRGGYGVLAGKNKGSILTSTADNTLAAGINDYCAVAATDYSIRFLLDTPVLLTRNNDLIQIPTPGGGPADAYAIDNNKNVLGYEFGVNLRAPFVWGPDYGSVELVTLIEGDGSINDIYAADMSSRGVIVGTTIENGVSKGLILQPLGQLPSPARPATRRAPSAGKRGA